MTIPDAVSDLAQMIGNNPWDHILWDPMNPVDATWCYGHPDGCPYTTEPGGLFEGWTVFTREQVEGPRPPSTHSRWTTP